MLVSNVYMLCMLSPLKLTQLVLNVSKLYTISLCDPGYPNSVNLLPYSTY